MNPIRVCLDIPKALRKKLFVPVGTFLDAEAPQELRFCDGVLVQKVDSSHSGGVTP